MSVRLTDDEATQADASVTAAGWAAPHARATAALIRADWKRAREEATNALATLREVAAFPCASPEAASGWWADCRQREREAMGGTLPPEVQRRHWCARCVAKDAVERLDSGDVTPVGHDVQKKEEA